MASFTDKSFQFNPYIQELPVQEMVQVGMQKQAQYNQGVQKIQNYIDRVAGVDVYLDVDKQYLQSKLNELGNNLRTVAAGDFSNQQLVNSVAGMASQISKDQLITNAIGSTARYRSGLSKIQKDIDEGKSNPANIKNFEKQAQPWLSSKKPGAVFNGTYNPQFDVFKFFKEQFDAVKPGNWSSDKIFEYNKDGSIKFQVIRDKNNKIIKESPILSPYMIREEYEGRLPEEVKATISAIFSDPRVRKQLQITGEYNLENISGEGLVGLINEQRDNNLTAYNDLISELSLEKNLEKDDNKKKEIEDRIEKVTSNIKDIKKSYATYAETAMIDPDAVRGKLYTDSMSDMITQMYGGVKKSIKAMDSPAYQMRFKEIQEANDIAEFNARLKFDYASLAQTASEKQKDRELAKELALLNLAKGGRGAGGLRFGAGIGVNELGNTWEYGDTPSDMDILGDFNNRLAGAADKMSASGNSLVWDSVISTRPENVAKLEKLMNAGKTKNEAIKILINNTAAAAKQTPTEFVNYWTNRIIDKVNFKGKVDPNIQDAYYVYKRAEKDFSDINNQNKIYNDEVTKIVGDDIVKKINDLDIKPIAIQYKGKDFEVSKEDLSDLAIYMRGNQSLGGIFDGVERNRAAKQAEERLIGKGKGFLTESGLDLFAGGPSSQLVRMIKVIGKSTPRLFGGDNPYITDKQGRTVSGSPFTLPGEFAKSLKKVYDIVATEDGSKAAAAKAQLIKNKGFVNPNLKSNLLTEDAKINQKVLTNLRNYAGEYSNKGNNLAGSEEIKNVLSALGGDLKDLSIEARIMKGSSGEPVPSVRIRNFATNTEGTMILKNDEALNVGVDVSKAYEPELITNIRNKIKLSPRSATSAGPVNDLKTYKNGDAYFDGVEDFPQLKGSPFEAKGNILYSDATGLYYGWIYGKNKITGKEGLVSTDYFEDLSELVGRMKTTPPQLIQNLLK